MVVLHYHVTSAAVVLCGYSIVVVFLLLLLPLFCWGFALGPYFVVHCLVLFLVLLSSHWEKRELVSLLKLNLDVVWLLVFFVSSSRFHGFFYSL